MTKTIKFGLGILLAGVRTSLALSLFGGNSIAIDSASPLSGSYDYGSDPSEWPTVYATTGVGGGTFDLNTFLGANRYYSHSIPITGQNATASNLEAGHIWNGHETMQHVDTFINSADTFGDGDVEPLYDRHATWAAMLIGGRETLVDPDIKQSGLAPGANLISAAISTGWSGVSYTIDFGLSVDSYLTAYGQSYAQADVINTSYGYNDFGGIDVLTIYTDAMAYQNPFTTHVASAGNSAFPNTVGAPGAGYNTIAVAALGGANSYDAVAGFSSRGPQDFSYYDYYDDFNIVTIPGGRASVDIAAPGTDITSAFYGGQTGGNTDSDPDNVTGSVDLGSDADAYSSSIGGTSFAAPIVAGGATLMVSAAKTLPELSNNQNATHSMVIRSILMTGADKIAGWDNGQAIVTDGENSYIETTQSLDWDSGAGRMNLDRAFDIQVNGQRDVAGLSVGQMGAVETMGWDFGNARLGFKNDYVLREPLIGNSDFTATLTWMRIRMYDGEYVDDVAQSDLNLSVWSLDESGNFSDLIARSASELNTAEHLAFKIPSDGQYGIRVEYEANTFDNTTGLVWGSEGLEQEYAISWFGTAIPEPAMATIYIFVALGIITLRRVVARFRVDVRESSFQR